MPNNSKNPEYVKYVLIEVATLIEQNQHTLANQVLMNMNMPNMYVSVAQLAQELGFKPTKSEMRKLGRLVAKEPLKRRMTDRWVYFRNGVAVAVVYRLCLELNISTL